MPGIAEFVSCAEQEDGGRTKKWRFDKTWMHSSKDCAPVTKSRQECTCDARHDYSYISRTERSCTSRTTEVLYSRTGTKRAQQSSTICTEL